ncbi:glycoside hydrolase family 88 protein [Chitinophagaceae bacterium LB-8]|uniref:Glycoside hydrolase family 88 protein n=1 Tax=Paraflavisolibacter caeni TaxID=2982496 RepID=A0A9X3BJF1_9BACT|nr:glycoside hydrolase family 88 protein [Paraflavisolibacter caeni]MCU7552757.1 glycoside hydrolase family 88 protein [Paraflavisolibacter caeni]
MKVKVILFALFTIGCFEAGAQKINRSKVWSDAVKQSDLMLEHISMIRDTKPELVTPRTIEEGSLKMVKSGDWTSGFFPGILWMLYQHTGNGHWKQDAEKFTALLEKEQWNGDSHDVGFKIYCSFGNGYRLTNNPHYKDVIIQSAKTLVARYNSKIGAIRSWDFRRDQWQFPVIVDNMMNLELLFAATRLSGDSLYYQVAVHHANTTLKNHFRQNFSSYHVVDYDTLTGEARRKMTFQGYADESAWARGQAWGLYGFTMCYWETKDKRYLQQADSIASFILNNAALPKDGVPYWDFNDRSIPAVPRDASAAAIIASALFELSQYSSQGARYKKIAGKMLESLTNHYRSKPGDHSGFILLHSTGHKPANSEVDVPINYADYYYLEALLRSGK